MKIIGREQEQKELQRLLNSDNSEFVMIYGRRRVGKTFLVRETLGKDFCFAMTGLAKQNRKAQLLNFQRTLARYSKRLAKISNQNSMRNMHYNSLINKNITLDDLINV